jgi:hypothetical protein
MCTPIKELRKERAKSDPLIYIAGKNRASSGKLLILLTPPKPYECLPLELKYAIIKLIQFIRIFGQWRDPQALRLETS